MMSDLTPTRSCRSPAAKLPVRHGVTLVELLIVMGIIAILMAVMLAIATKVGHMREKTGCMGNLRNVGVAAWTFALDNRGALPEHYRDDDASFDTTMMRKEDESFVNLGQVLGYVSAPQTLYCPSFDEHVSPALAYDSKSNKFKRGKSEDEEEGQGFGHGDGEAAKKNPKFDPPVGVNSSFPARSRLDIGIRPLAWAARNYSNKVIYSDFVGVDGWQGRGRWQGVIYAPHQSAGYNRLFGDGAVNWTDAKPLNDVRPIDENEPSADDFYGYYELLDVLP